MSDTTKETNRDAEIRYHLCERAIMKAMKAREEAHMDVYIENVDELVKLIKFLFENGYSF